jgi:diguanylate cyclase (GGDEF)-like protein
MEQLDLTKLFLLVIDFDSFKEINDQYGHNIGDLVLVKAANIIKKHFRDSDYVCRIGGDEFTIILPNVEEGVVDIVREKVKLINAELVAPSDLPSVSISAGGAFGKDAEDAYELFNNADHALYEMKFGGKCGFKLFKKR